jgi:hypothetical protein
MQRRPTLRAHVTASWLLQHANPFRPAELHPKLGKTPQLLNNAFTHLACTGHCHWLLQEVQACSACLYASTNPLTLPNEC